ncbi:uronate dehydrogenase [Hasllibacter halocynthiae]|uniref:Uronate dehydrogenase n=1 Tax=Hasllibacter halocynthiae TaxID=595589 RepID=A0A2T0X6R3_9RHOB|nr:NAD(P)-dependent oxidoreductase [Hasllibacter halocynthiae]PRY94613.1 uronate dehydrogenase [Hasllibacter halocynthiae]
MLEKLVLTGAAGNLGGHLRAPLSRLCRELVSSDIAEGVGDLAPNETYVKADLGDPGAMLSLLEGAEMVVHFGAIADEAPWEAIHRSNLLGAFNVWEAAYRNGLRRVVYASSIHAVGMVPKTEAITVDTPHRPDTFYGLAKCFAEDLGRLYWEKRRLESVHMRILSCTPKPNNARAIGSWLSYDDLTRLVTRAIDTPVTGFSVIYGVSDNDRSPVDNSGASHLGYRPRDNAEKWAREIYAASPPLDPTDDANLRHGGPFATTPLGEGAEALLNPKG